MRDDRLYLALTELMSRVQHQAPQPQARELHDGIEGQLGYQVHRQRARKERLCVRVHPNL